MVALYALALQSLLGGAAYGAASDPAHILCAAGAQGGEGPSKPHQAHAHPACCTLAQAFAPAPPVPASLVIVWPARQASAVTWRPEAAASPRAPPGVSASARGPPVV